MRLHRDWNARAARKHFRRAVDWTRKVKKRSRQIDLYLVPEKAQDITQPPEKPLKKTEHGALVPVDTGPKQLINRNTASWYLDRLFWRSNFYLGFIEFVDKDYDAAKKHWTAAFERNKQLQKQHDSQIGSFYRRLMNACRGKRFIATPREMEAFRHSEGKRLKLMMADFYALWLRWDRAESLYHRLLKGSKLNHEQEAVVLQCLAAAESHQRNWKKARERLQRILNDYPQAHAAVKARIRYAHICSKSFDKKVQMLLTSYRAAPQSEAGMKALYEAGFACWAKGKQKEAKKHLNLFLNRYPESRLAGLATDLLRHSSHTGNNKNQFDSDSR